MNKPAAQPTLAVHQIHDTAPDIRALSEIDGIDYIDHFTLTTDDARAATPKQWAKAAFEGAAGTGGQFIWRVLLLLRLKRRPDRIAGWEVADSSDHHVRLSAVSPLMTGELIVHLTDDEVNLITVIRYRRRFGRFVWDRLSPIHRKVAADLLRDTHRLLFG